jgi:hypothetical protein
MMDPILTPIILGGLGSAGVTTAIGISAATFLAHVLSFVIVAGVAVGLYLLTAPSLPKPEDGKTPIQETVPPRGFAYGRARLAGSLMLKEVNGTGHNLGVVLALVSHEIKGFVKIFLNDDKAEFGGVDFPASFPDGFLPVDVQTDGRYGDDRVVISVRHGLVPETHMSMFADFLFLGRWPATCRGDGIASLGMVCSGAPSGEDSGGGDDTQQKRFPYGAPAPSAVCDTAFVWDPRDVDQDPADPATWTFSRNPALCIIHFLCFSEFGFRYKYQDAILPVVGAWQHAANVCFEDVPSYAGDDLNRYELGGFATTDNNPKEVLGMMLAACDGWLCRRGDGSCLLIVGKFEPESITITDEDILGFSLQKGVGDEDVVNRLDVQLNSQDHDWTQIECDAWDDNQDQIERGHVRETVFDLKWVQDYRRARRLAKREFYRLNEPIRGTLELRLSAINAAYTRWIYVQSDIIPSLNNRYIENRAARYELAGVPPKIHMEFLGIDPEKLENWGVPVGAETEGDALHRDEGHKPPDMVHSGIAPIATPQNLVVTKESDHGVEILRYTWDIDVDDHGWYSHDIRYRVDDTPPGVWRTERIDTNPVNDSSTRWYLDSRSTPVPAVDWEGQVRIRNGRSVGEWSNIDSTAS